MPPNPWKLLKFKELTNAQRRELNKALTKRQLQLKRAMDAIEAALKQLSRALDQEDKSKYAKKVRRKKT
jgi:hypothetical protein